MIIIMICYNCISGLQYHLIIIADIATILHNDGALLPTATRMGNLFDMTAMPDAPLPTADRQGELDQDALRLSESRYRRLFEAAQDGILLLNGDTAKIEDANPYLIKML